MLRKVKEFSHQLPDKKRYFEFITALLTIPVMVTVLVINLNNLRGQKVVENQTQILPTPTVPASRSTGETDRKTANNSVITQTPTVTPSPDPVQCKREIGPVSLVSPEQNEILATDPVCLDISREGSNYCAVVWSYRINGGAWSDYTDKSICLYSLVPGYKKLELRIKSVVSGEEKILERTFSIAGSTQTPTPTSSTSSALLQPS